MGGGGERKIKVCLFTIQMFVYVFEYIMQFAADEINKNPDLIPGVKIVLYPPVHLSLPRFSLASLPLFHFFYAEIQWKKCSNAHTHFIFFRLIHPLSTCPFASLSFYPPW